MKFTFFETIGKLIVRYHSFFEEGIINTLIIAAFAVLFGTILGTLMASMRMSRILPLRWIATAYIEFIRGTPLMVQLMFIFYGLPMAGITLPDISWIPNFFALFRRHHRNEPQQLRVHRGDHPLRCSGC